jgi:hypothetical protein
MPERISSDLCHMSDKRLLSRSICADLVYLDWNDKGPRECVAVLEDISSRGACLQVERPVPVEIEATIRHGENWSAHCFVKYCSFREIGYFVGIEFKGPEAWSRFEFLPKHLLDLRELARESD